MVLVLPTELGKWRVGKLRKQIPMAPHKACRQTGVLPLTDLLGVEKAKRVCTAAASSLILPRVKL